MENQLEINQNKNSNQINSQNYLSSIFNDEVAIDQIDKGSQPEGEIDQTEENKQQPKVEEGSYIQSIKRKFQFLGLYIISFIALIIILYVSPLVLLFIIFNQIRQLNPFIFRNIIFGSIFILCLLSVCYTLLVFFFFQNQNVTYKHLLSDSISFICSSFLVITYIQTVINLYCEEQNDFGTNFGRLMASVIYSIYDVDSFYSVDYQIQEFNFDILKEQGFPNISRKFSLLSINNKLSNLDHNISKFFFKFQERITPNYYHFLILFTIICLKLFLVFYYISLNSIAMTTNDIIEISIIIFTYLFTTLNLNRILGNNDIIRKSKLIQELNDYISFQDDYDPKSHKKLDITCPISLESWDMARKYILNFQKDLLNDLELSYFCLIFYYIFVVLIIVSYFFELYWIFSQHSPFLNPITIIMSTFTFFFLTCFLLFRFKEGTKYNESFMELESSLNNLTDLIEDLQTMFDSFFNRKNNREYNFEKEDRNSIYGLMIKRIKLLSKYYIEQKISYQGVVYNNQNKDILRKEIIQTIKQSLEKVKKSVQQDSNEHKYLFLNVMEINFNDFATTNLFGLVTVLPTIVPKFIQFFENQKKE